MCDECLGAIELCIKLLDCLCLCCLCCSSCLSCCLNGTKNRSVSSSQPVAPVIITSTSHTTPYGQPGCAPQPGFAPYPNVAPAPGFAGYPPQSTGPSPYPTQQYTQAPYPPHNATTTAYPTPSVAPVAVAESMNPPTYDQAVHGDTATAPVTAPVTAGYQKQAPYNPNF